jgi:hypothetical protein
MATYNSGQVKFGTPGAVIDSTIPSRRLYDFSDRVAELSPEESPFFVYLSKVAKVPTSDSQFRFLEDRTKIAMTDRSFHVDGAVTLAAPGGLTNVTVESAAGSTDSTGQVGWLIKGMVCSFQQNNNDDHDTDDSDAIITATGRIESVTHNSADTTIQVRTIQASAGDSSTTSVEDTGRVTVIGTSYQEGSGAPDVWSQELDNRSGYTQIFKTACEMTNTARATVYRGYADEWARLWNLKLREHKIDIERAMLFGMQGSQSGVQYTDGITGNIIKNAGTAIQGGVKFSYSEKTPYLKSVESSQLTYDELLSDFEVIFDPARGGSTSKLALASLPVMSHFNKLGASDFVNQSLAGESRYNFAASQGSFGHQVLKVDTIHGDLSLVKEPLFRANFAGYLCMIDLDHVSYRPLVGNGVNRDTSITTNVQQADEDLRKDMILTEAGLEVSLPETHALYNLEGVL